VQDGDVGVVAGDEAPFTLSLADELRGGGGSHPDGFGEGAACEGEDVLESLVDPEEAPG
jgi:hypothetical protein